MTRLVVGIACVLTMGFITGIGAFDSPAGLEKGFGKAIFTNQTSHSAKANRFTDLHDETLWKEVQAADNRRAYEFYLSRFPDGRFATRASKRVSEIEASFWKSAFDSNGTELVIRYLTEYPEGRFLNEAWERLSQLEELQERKFWGYVETKDTIGFYRSYLARYPSGSHRDAAKARIRTLEEGASRSDTSSSPERNRLAPAGILLSWIPPGEFKIGVGDEDRIRMRIPCVVAGFSLKDCQDPKSLPYWRIHTPQVRIKFREGFWIGSFEITQGEYFSIMGVNPSFYKSCGLRCPVENISWFEAKEFIAKLNALEGDLIYSLPTEAEWEYAARAGSSLSFAPPRDDYWHIDNSGLQKINGLKLAVESPSDFQLLQLTNKVSTHPVGSSGANGFMIWDMIGNVAEWVEDTPSEKGYKDLPSDGSANTRNNKSDNRVARGCYVLSLKIECMFATRVFALPHEKSGHIGFRVVARQRK